MGGLKQECTHTHTIIGMCNSVIPWLLVWGWKGKSNIQYIPKKLQHKIYQIQILLEKWFLLQGERANSLYFCMYKVKGTQSCIPYTRLSGKSAMNMIK